jgi:hypothetical protein
MALVGFLGDKPLLPALLIWVLLLLLVVLLLR